MVKDDQEANGKSIMGLLTLVAAHGVTMTVVCDGDDAEAAVAALAELVGTRVRGGGRSVMEKLVGVGASPGIAIGVAHVLGEPGRHSRTPDRRRAGRRRAAPLRVRR